LNERDNERQRTNPKLVGGYLAPMLVVLFTIFWVLLAYWLIGWRARDWQFGAAPYVPGQSVFTTRRVPTGAVPKQVELPRKPEGGNRAER
jgi:hypothetical protein